MAHAYRLNDDGTVQVKHNGAWLTLEEVLDLKDRQLADSRKEVLELDKERERLEYEKNLPVPQVVDSSDDEYETITERSFNGDQITYTTRKNSNSGSLIASGGYTTGSASTWSSGVNVDSMDLTYPKIQVQRGGLDFANPPEFGGESPQISWVDESQTLNPAPKTWRRLRRKD